LVRKESAFSLINQPCVFNFFVFVILMINIPFRKNFSIYFFFENDILI
jgi:hypothetical protein